MTEQMTGRKGPAGTERPAGDDPRTAGPSGPSPRDLAARSPHHPPGRAADQARPAEAPPQGAASTPAQSGPAQGIPAQGAPRAGHPGAGRRVRAAARARHQPG